MPLYLRILLLFLLNIAVLLGAATWAAHRQMQQGIQSMLGTMVGFNLQKATEGIYDDLLAKPQSQWGSMMEKFEQTHGVKCGLFEMPNTHIVGSEKKLPEDVAKGMFPKLGGSSGPGMRPGRGMGPPGDRPDGPPPRPGGGEQGPAGRSSKDAPRDFAKGLIRSGTPSRYWAVALLPPVLGNEPGPPRRLIFAIVTNSVFTCPLLFDLRPWLLAIGAALLFSSLLWLPFVRGITSKLSETMQATKLMASGKLTTRIREGRSDEIGQLAIAVNSMAEQLDGYVSGQRRFTRDIAHELCSPISRMQVAMGVLDTSSLNNRQRHYLDALSDELQHMSHLVEELLQFAKSTHQHDQQLTEMVLEPIIQSAIDRETGHLDDAAINVNVPNDLIVKADPILLSRALSNVLRNALRYAAHGGPVEITAQATSAQQVLITIRSFLPTRRSPQPRPRRHWAWPSHREILCGGMRWHSHRREPRSTWDGSADIDRVHRYSMNAQKTDPVLFTPFQCTRESFKISSVGPQSARRLVRL
jgi:two-component system, OmpR family, sensor histidine kinase CpxA